MKSLFLLLLLVPIAQADSFTKLGCYSKSSVQSQLSYSDQYTYQSSSHCESQCAGKKVAALMDGKYCYCGSLAPDSSDQVDDDNCDTSCQGYPEEKCGGDGYFLIYSNSDVESEDDSSSSSEAESSTSADETSTSADATTSSSSSSTTSSSSTSSKSKSTSTTKTSSSSSSPSSTSDDSSLTSSSHKADGMTTLVSTITASPSGSSHESVVEITTTSQSSSSGGGSKSDDNNDDNKKKSKQLSTGGIVGAVIGSVAGAGLLGAGVLFFLWHKRKQNDDDADDEFTLSGPEKPDDYQVNSNPFVQGGHVNHGSNALEAMGVTMAGAGAAGAGAGYAGSRAASGRAISSHGHKSSDMNMLNSYSSTSNNDEMFNFDDSQGPNYGDYARPEDLGRRRLSDGSLPDMIARNPGSLKVVNN